VTEITEPGKDTSTQLIDTIFAIGYTFRSPKMINGTGALKTNNGDKMNNNILKIGGIVAIVIGAGALYMSGVSESAAMLVVGAVFTLAAVVAAILKK
jgi:hypothetical protein